MVLVTDPGFLGVISMKDSRLVKRAWILVLGGVLCVFSIPARSAAATEYTMADLPSGSWTYSAHGDWRQGCTTVPVLAFSITTNANKGLKSTGLGLWNRHPTKSVASVDLAWVLTTAQARSTVLYQGTATVTIPYLIKPGLGTAVDPGVPAFAQIAQSMSNPLSGNYWLEVCVVGITWSDETTWTRSSGDLDVASAPECPPAQHCGTQKCDWNLQALSYVCVQSTVCERCKVLSYDRCNNEHCTATVVGVTLGGSFALLELDES